MAVWMFPGQGSQFKGMGQGLFGLYPEECAIASDVLGCPIDELCLADPDQRLGQTQWTQPALFTVNALHFRNALRDGTEPGYLVGHSLGEYNALHAAGMFDFRSEEHTSELQSH